MTYDLIIFDYDGVVADSEVLNSTVMAEQLTAIGLPTTLDQVLGLQLGRTDVRVEDIQCHAAQLVR